MFTVLASRVRLGRYSFFGVLKSSVIVTFRSGNGLRGGPSLYIFGGGVLSV